MTPRYTQRNVIDAAIIQDLEQKKRKLTSKRNRKIKRPGVYKVNSYYLHYKNLSSKYKTTLAY